MLALFGLGAWGQDRIRQPLMLLQAVGELVTAERARAAVVVSPDAGGGDARDVCANDHFDGKWLALDADHDAGVGHVDDVIGDDVLGLFEPPGRKTIEDLPLIRQRAEDAIKGADAVGHHDIPLAVRDVAVANLALVLASKRFEIRSVEGLREPFVQSLGRYGHLRFLRGRDR